MISSQETQNSHLNYRGKFSGAENSRIWKSSRQGAKAPSSEAKEKYSYEFF
jgi:hypothetical protein